LPAHYEGNAEATAYDNAVIASYDREHIAGVSVRVLRTMENMDDHALGLPVDRLVHSLQTAIFALAAGEGEEMVVAALLHDIVDDLAPENHGNFAADILCTYVAERTHWIVAHHDSARAMIRSHSTRASRRSRLRLSNQWSTVS
jgi:predicted HD phosphohydrolase